MKTSFMLLLAAAATPLSFAIPAPKDAPGSSTPLTPSSTTHAVSNTLTFKGTPPTNSPSNANAPPTTSKEPSSTDGASLILGGPSSTYGDIPNVTPYTAPSVPPTPPSSTHSHTHSPGQQAASSPSIDASDLSAATVSPSFTSPEHSASSKKESSSSSKPLPSPTPSTSHPVSKPPTITPTSTPKAPTTTPTPTANKGKETDKKATTSPFPTSSKSPTMNNANIAANVPSTSRSATSSKAPTSTPSAKATSVTPSSATPTSAKPITTGTAPCVVSSAQADACARKKRVNDQIAELKQDGYAVPEYMVGLAVGLSYVQGC